MRCIPGVAAGWIFKRKRIPAPMGPGYSFFNTYRFPQLLPRHAQGQVGLCLQKPFYQSDAAVLDFYAGDAAWVDAAPDIEIRGIRRSGHGAVGMPRDEQFLFLGCPCGKASFRLLFLGIIAGGAGRVGYAERFQGLPEVPHQEAGQRGQGAVQEIGLVSMGEIKFHAGNGIVQDEPGQETEIRKQFGRFIVFRACGDLMAGGFSGKVLAVARTTVPAAVPEAFFAVVVVPVEHVEPALAMEFFQQAEDVAVDVYDAGEGTVFPELVAVP